MKRETISHAISGIRMEYIAECETYSPALRVLPSDQENTMEKKHTTKKIIVIGLAACLVLALGITAYGSQVIQKIFGWGNTMEISQFTDENGDEATEVLIHTEEMVEPVEIQDGRMFFIVNGENLDITDLVSETEAYAYEYEDEAGNTHLWLVGLLSDAPDHYGYGEYIRNSEGEWIGGYSARINIEPDGSTAAQWLESAKAERNIPW